MCGRFSIFSHSRDLADHFALSATGEYITSYNVTPANNIPVIRLKEENRELANCHWGLIPHWAKNMKYKPINARVETIAEKPFFRDAFKKRRCLIPANGFYEWKGSKGHKQPYYFKLKKTALFAFAGLWDHWENEENIIESCTIITTTANLIMQPIHDRMPVILDPDHYDEWLFKGNKDLLTPYPEVMDCYPVSTVVNSPVVKGKDLIQPLE